MKILHSAFRWSGIHLIYLAFALATALLFTNGSASAAGEFTTIWKTDNPGQSSSNQISIPTNSAAIYNYTVDWGDGQTDNGVTGPKTHTYSSVGTYTVKISGQFPRISFEGNGDTGKILSIESWGNIQWEIMSKAFEGCYNLVVNATDAPDLSNVINIESMFERATSFNQNISHWNVSNVKIFASMFEGATSFNQPLNGWNTGSAKAMQSVFQGATSFNQPLNGWNMNGVDNTKSMFNGAVTFNQSLSNWDMHTVLDMSNMFQNTSVFNSDISGWNTMGAYRMEYMFKNALAFDQNLSGWDIQTLGFATEMFDGIKLSLANYDALLEGWSKTNKSNINLGAGDSQYCSGTDARNILFGRGWNINDGGQDSSACELSSVSFTSGGTVNENQNPNTLVGSLTAEGSYIGASGGLVFSLNCTSGSVDNNSFTLSGNQIFTGIAFDYENPVDRDNDNIYELCIRVTNASGSIIERVIEVSVIDLSDGSGTGGQVLGTNTGNGSSSNNGATGDNDTNNEVLGDGDDPATLAETGITILSQMTVGLLLMGSVVYMYKELGEKINTYRLQRR